MEYKLLGVSTEKELNIGDYVQALASYQFLPSLDGFIQREALRQYNGKTAKMIMNGWYMHHPENWPPSERILPLFVAFHLNSLAKARLLENDSINYLKKHQPIGCRDHTTAALLKEKGVDAYFSGCMTLTLGLKYKDENKDEKVFFVDPYFKTNWNFTNLIKNGIYLLKNRKAIKIISDKYPETKKGWRKKMILTAFYREYQKFFTKETLLNAEYINQQSVSWKQHHKTETDYLKEAELLVKKYAKAKLVVTSRIHCALPCLGLETPVVYTEDSHQSEASRCRLDGLRQLFNILSWRNGKLYPEFEMNGKLSINSTPANKQNWKEIALDLTERCRAFITGNSAL
ncbi:hypothetical protein A8C56_06215 [Niabella ginsenosidivorans]|uniref:Polysaccharide pyruvyl transferase domain-containing protein n=1 Tax=Niabella ginsenosidivorans TaxID=1176587 RepID=A0A1A9I1N3_9BACT|nr:polysaccharide pyruvyl transferase family protein [Niabella ginsenosidivorans]ANH80630.1 hypothetical protein A8C56_06215 [Niabella ginsenosidivorans]